MSSPYRHHAPAAERNREPIFEVLSPVLPASAVVLELASGTGQHAAHFARQRPDIIWQPSDPNPDLRESIDGWAQHSEASNIRPALDIDVRAQPWPVDHADVVYCANMVHITPWACTEGLVAGAARLLPESGLLFLYGPYNVDGAFTSESNAAFDQSLRARDPRWGIRDLAEIEALAGKHGLQLEARVAMPANNFSLLLRRTGTPA